MFDDIRYWSPIDIQAAAKITGLDIKHMPLQNPPLQRVTAMRGRSHDDKAVPREQESAIDPAHGPNRVQTKAAARLPSVEDRQEQCVRGKGNGPKGSQALVLDGLPGRSAAQLLMYGPKTLYKCLQEQGCGARRTAGALRGRVEMKQPETPRLRQTIRSDPHSI